MEYLATWVSGELVAEGQLSVRADDRGLVGDGVFEALKVVDGTPFALRRHLARLANSAQPLGITIDFDEIATGIEAVTPIGDVREQLCWMRITVTGGPAQMGKGEQGAHPTTVVSVAPLPTYAKASDVVVLPWTRNERGALAGLKTLSYMENGIGLRHAQRAGVDEGIFANTAGNLCEGSGTNVFAVHEGRLITPPLSCGALDGVTRQLVLEWMPEIVVEDISMEEFLRCDEVFLTSTSRDIHPVRSIDGRELPDTNGPLTRSVADRFEQMSLADPNP